MTKVFTKIIFVVLSVFLLVYMLLPGPTSINNFSLLPNSFRSQDPGDTYQIEDVFAFYSNNYRDFVTKFYRKDYQEKTKFSFLPIRLNYPPEMAFTYIKDQTVSTYLEEYVYPLRDSVFVNGFEPVLANGKSRFPGGAQYGVNNNHYNTKVVVRFYPSAIWVRVLVWLGINIAVIGLLKMYRRVLYA